MAIKFTDFLNDKIPEDRVVDARLWFRETAQEVEIQNTQSVITKTSQSLGTNRLLPGRLYLFKYNPKLRMELPYYDMFPVIFLIDVKEEGFTGINMHYLPLTYRAMLMDNLYKFVTGTGDLMTRIRMTYDRLKTLRKLRFFRPCFKYYLNTQVRSRFIMVPPDQWEVALFLPLQRFRKANINVVHRDSLRTIRNYNNVRGRS